MGREERKWRKHLEERGKRERRLLAKAAQTTKQFTHSDADSNSREATVIGISPGQCRVSDGGQEFVCRCDLDAAINDRVLYSPERQRIERILPRRSALSRPDPHNPHVERVLAANIDVVVIVVSVKSPPLRPGLIDRYLIAIENSGASPVLCVNKVDLADDQEYLSILNVYRECGVPVVPTSTATGEGIEELAALLSGNTCVFTGHSGVGKSSLLNALAPDLDLTTGGVSDGAGKGRHTTTFSTIHRLPNGAAAIDTPGIREFGLWDVTAVRLRDYFPEFRNLSAGCQFRDCSHTHEPACGVREAATDGRIAASRYAAYLRIFSALEPKGTLY